MVVASNQMIHYLSMELGRSAPWRKDFVAAARYCQTNNHAIMYRFSAGLVGAVRFGETMSYMMLFVISGFTTFQYGSLFMN